MFPSPSQIITKTIVEVLQTQNEPGFGQRVEIWNEDGIILYVFRRENDYSLRFQTEGLTSLPIFHFRQRWETDRQALQRTSDWLELVRNKRPAHGRS